MRILGEKNHKNIKGQHCARCVYYLSEITTRTNNLKNTLLVLMALQSNPPKRIQSTGAYGTEKLLLVTILHSEVNIIVYKKLFKN